MEYNTLPEWMITSKMRERSARAQKRREIARNIVLALILLACFIGAGYSDHQALQLGLIH